MSDMSNERHQSVLSIAPDQRRVVPDVIESRNSQGVHHGQKVRPLYVFVSFTAVSVSTMLSVHLGIIAGSMVLENPFVIPIVFLTSITIIGGIAGELLRDDENKLTKKEIKLGLIIYLAYQMLQWLLGSPDTIVVLTYCFCLAIVWLSALGFWKISFIAEFRRRVRM